MFCSKCKLNKNREDFGKDPTRHCQINYWCKSCINERQRENYPKHALKYRERHLKKTYNLDLKTFNSLVESQNNRCKICKQEKELYVDHDHITGKIRGLLCCHCNNGLGNFKDNREFLLNAYNYL
jgi:Recombination endonuclease VII